MSDDQINYAIVALTKVQVQEVVVKLRGEKEDILLSWLNKYKDQIYGDLPEDWKPFGEDNTIKEIIEENSENYHSETDAIESLSEDCCNIDDINHIQVFFIDIFSMYIDKYRKLATRSDLAFCPAKEHNCCFLMDFRLPVEVQEKLELIYKELWPSVSKRYNEGCVHRMASRIDDLNNFKNFLNRNKNSNKPHPKSGSQVASRFEKYGVGPLPRL